MHILLLCISVFLACGKSLVLRFVSGSAAKPKTFWKTNTFIFLAAFILLAIFALADPSRNTLSLYSVFLSLGFSFVMIAGQAFYILAQSRGPVSLNTFLYSCGFIIPSVYGMIQDRSSVSCIRLLGFLLLIAVLYVYILPSKEKVDKKWILCISLATIMSGITGIMQRVHQTSAYAAELNPFLVSTFFFCTVFSLCLCFCLPKSGEPENNTSAKQLLWPCVTGVVIALLNRCNLFLAGALPSIVFYPVFNGAVTLLTGAAAAVLFHERLNRRQILCLAVGVFAILLLNV